LWFKTVSIRLPWGIGDAVQHLIYADKDNFPQGSFSARTKVIAGILILGKS
jgi:hypothetical protein